MQHALGSCRRNNETFGILMIDLDRFKTVNDTHGHEVGDRVLCEVAELMRNSLREGDTVARLGGEEFLVVLRNIGPQATVDVAEALRRRIEDEVQVADGWNCTVSVGALHVSDAISDSDSLIAAADCALYRAKEHGRNMVVVAMEQDAIDNPCSGPTRVRLIQDDVPAPTAATVVDPANESTHHQGAGRP